MSDRDESPVSADRARDLILSGCAPPGLIVRDPGAPSLATRLHLENCPELKALPAGLVVWGGLHISNCPDLRSLPADMVVKDGMALINCPGITELPDDMCIGSSVDGDYWVGGLGVYDCPGIMRIPESLKLRDLAIKNCHSLIDLPRRLSLTGDLRIDHCHGLTFLPEEMGVGGLVFLRDLPSVRRLPRRLETRWLRILDCPGITEISDLSVLSLQIHGQTGLRAFPTNINVRGLLLEDAAWLTEIPEDLGWNLDALSLPRCSNLERFPTGLRAHHLGLVGCTGLRTLPPGLRVRGELCLSGCTKMAELPPDLKDDVPCDDPGETVLDLSGCSSLTSLPDHIFAGDRFMYCADLHLCTNLRSLPDSWRVEWVLDLSGCPALTELPAGLWVGRRLNLSGCSGLTQLPEDLFVGEELEITGTGIRELPESLRHVRLTEYGIGEN
jgi:hypothetical protein